MIKIFELNFLLKQGDALPGHLTVTVLKRITYI